MYIFIYIYIYTHIHTYTYICWYKIHQCFLQAIAKAIQPLTQIPCMNCRELSNFICKISCFFLRISSERSQ